MLIFWTTSLPAVLPLIIDCCGLKTFLEDSIDWVELVYVYTLALFYERSKLPPIISELVLDSLLGEGLYA